jgi:peptidoglycan-associated lipoprotein
METRRSARVAVLLMAVFVSVSLGACAKKVPPVARPAPPTTPPPTAVTPHAPPAPPAPVSEPAIPPVAPLREDPLTTRSLDDLNRESPLKPVFYDYNSTELSGDAVGVLRTNAETLKKYATWIVTIEGHCDERGTAEYNLALGERRAVASRTYLVSLGIPAERIRIVSYGKEFPFDPGHTEEAWAKNRRAHFVITAK